MKFSIITAVVCFLLGIGVGLVVGNEYGYGGGHNDVIDSIATSLEPGTAVIVECVRPDPVSQIRNLVIYHNGKKFMGCYNASYRGPEDNYRRNFGPGQVIKVIHQYDNHVEAEDGISWNT